MHHLPFQPVDDARPKLVLGQADLPLLSTGAPADSCWYKRELAVLQ